MTFQRTYFILLIGLFFLPRDLAYAQEGSVDADAGKYQVPNRLIDSREGPDLFRTYCAACHGADARGGGPAASSLTAKVPDLTRIAQRRDGTFK